MSNGQTKNLNNEPAEIKNLSEILNELMEIRGLDPKKLSELTDIPVHYVTLLSSGEFEKLPAIPYVRGYLGRIAEALRIDSDILLEAYKQEVSSRSLKTSGPADKLPSNRFVLKTPHRKRNFFIITIVILALIVLFFAFQIDGFFGMPKIQITNPVTDVNNYYTSSLRVSGEVNPRDKLTINGEEIFVEKNGRFTKEVSLQPGPNTIEFKVNRFLGKELKVYRQVIYQP